MTEDKDKWRKHVHGVANLRIEDGKRTAQNDDYRALPAHARYFTASAGPLGRYPRVRHASSKMGKGKLASAITEM